MGVLPQLRAAHVDTGKLRFVDADGNTIATITPEYLAVGRPTVTLSCRVAN
jgi:hypothetical protein